ncbi:hypothetical protein MC378_13155 [Polaribacter sp. MSW13]|uniref:Uncharacterized protein n=1 Tax=Polaribacter marinus TaxID=2916838 RepID=A0A9X1VPY2_9FLAO|nr:hypothetical protein [Polaribacter marinus]MCI2230120.1 hypothetical protein [Polaribacter marinus]
MQIDKKSNYTLISFDEKQFTNCYNSFLKEVKALEKEHLILQISEDINVTNKDFLLFLDIAAQKKENGTSFVVVNTKVNVNDFPETFNIVPTLQEAEDILEMEAIERELGF